MSNILPYVDAASYYGLLGGALLSSLLLFRGGRDLLVEQSGLSMLGYALVLVLVLSALWAAYRRWGKSL